MNIIILRSLVIGNDLSTAQFLSDEKLTEDEQSYYDDCKEYRRLTGKPIISVAEEVFDNDSNISSASIKFGIDEDCNKFDLAAFLHKTCETLGFTPNDIAIKRIQVGSVILEAEIKNKSKFGNLKLFIKTVLRKITDAACKAFDFLNMFFMFMGPIECLSQIQKHRADIKLNQKFNKKYGPEHVFWSGPCNDGRDRGGKPYFCPVGWQRWSFYVTDNFYKKFTGWSICYHGTKFEYGLSILLNGLKPAKVVAHGKGVYASPSINYVSHPRYAEVKRIESSKIKFFKSGRYIQFVLECRVNPKYIKEAEETLKAENIVIDSNINNRIIEWLIDIQDKDIVDFNDPDSPIVCTGILTRTTDAHPGLLPESQWWFRSHLCDNSSCCFLNIDRKLLKRQKKDGDECNIIFN